MPDWPTEIPDPTRDQVLAGQESGASIVGNPEDCAEALRRWDAVGVDQLIMGPSGSTYSDALLQETVELFGKQVIPEFDKDPEHSTSRYRAEAAKRLSLV